MKFWVTCMLAILFLFPSVNQITARQDCKKLGHVQCRS